MTHDNHEAMPGYSPDQVYVDGCAECAARARDLPYALGMMDRETFEAAWQRAADWQSGRAGAMLLQLSHTEAPVLRALWAVRVQLERMGYR